MFMLLVFSEIALHSVWMMCITLFSHIKVFRSDVKVETKLQPVYWINSLVAHY